MNVGQFCMEWSESSLHIADRVTHWIIGGWEWNCTCSSMNWSWKMIGCWKVCTDIIHIEFLMKRKRKRKWELMRMRKKKRYWRSNWIGVGLGWCDSVGFCQKWYLTPSCEIPTSQPTWAELTNWVTKRVSYINQLIKHLIGGCFFSEVGFGTSLF
jgi:hypothetical protein